VLIKGKSLQQIADHVERKTQVKMSKNSIARLFPPPHINSTGQGAYKGYINASASYIRNVGYDSVDEEHYNNAFIKIQMEFLTSFAPETLVICCDNKDSISLARTAVDRRVQNKKFCKENEAPVVPHHDYPRSESVSGLSIVPSGYLVLQSKTNLSTTESGVLPHGSYSTFSDESNRVHVDVPNTGPFYIFARCNRFYTANILTHINDIHAILQDYKHVGALAIPCDGGVDWNWTRSFKNVVAFGLLWKSLKLNALLSYRYLSQTHHRLPVEHAWSPITKHLAGFSFDFNLAGMSEAEQSLELDRQLDVLKSAFEGFRYDSHPVTVRPVKSSFVGMFSPWFSARIHY
jgi:hypothetical protein